MSRNKDLTGGKKPKRNPGGAPISIINHKIDVRPFHRTKQDIPGWRTALQSAESRIPRRVLLYDLYADVDLDGHVEAVTGKRRDPITTANWQFMDKDGKPVDEINELIDSIGFEDLLNEILNSKFWGYSMIEPKFFRGHNETWEMDTYLVPRINMRPHLGIIAEDAYSDKGINIRSGIYAKTIMEVGKVNDLGLYLKAAPYQILKRGGIGDFAMFVQVFGTPLVDATWDGFDESQRIKLLEAIEALGSGGAIVRPVGTTLEIKDKNVNSTGDLQVNFLSWLNKEISKSLLGSTETTESSDSSGYAQSKTHEGQDDRKHEGDIDFVRRILNSRFTRILKAHGFDTRGGKFIVQGEEDALTKKESFEIHKSLVKDLKLPVDDDFFYQTYGIPKPDNYKQLKEEHRNALNASPDKPDPDKPKEEKKAKPSADPEEEKVSLSLIEKVRSFFVSALPVKAGRASQEESCCGEILTLKLDDEPDIKGLIEAVGKADGKGYFYPEMFRHNAEVLTKAFKMGWDGKELIKLAVGFEYGVDDPAMLTAFEMNLFKFSGVKSAYEAARINALFRDAKNFSEFERNVRKLYGAQNRNHLIAEYNTAHAVGESAATYHRLLGQMETFPYWEYRTIGDERVRESHRQLHGRILPANHPLWKQIFPPNDWQCRCYIVPRLAGEVDEAKVLADIAFVQTYVTSPYWEKATKAGWGINRGDALEVFTEQQMYTADPDGVMNRLNTMTATDWMVLSMAAKQAQAKAKYNPSGGITQGTVTDYANRKIQATGFTGIQDILNDPDEVWISGNTWTYIRYYRDEVRKVEAYLTPGGSLEVINTGLATEASRTGLLIL